MDSSAVFSIGFGLWLLALSVVVFRMVSHYNRLTTGMTNKTLKEVLERLLEEHLRNKKDIQTLFSGVKELRDDGALHIQRLGVVRFNPFSDTGGSQSFTLALLDGAENGIVMTSLYARTGNRWYIKHVKHGEGLGVALSREEKAAVKEAKPVSQWE